MDNMPIIRESTLEERVARLKQIVILRNACQKAIESAQEEGVGHYRGTDEPRDFIKILQVALEAGPVKMNPSPAWLKKMANAEDKEQATEDP